MKLSDRLIPDSAKLLDNEGFGSFFQSFTSHIERE
jgi:hypothetical protein